MSNISNVKVQSGNKLILSGSSVEISGSVVRVSQSLEVANDITASGINVVNLVADVITAREYNTELVSASIIYESGSTKFGDDIGDTHQFSGSILVSGSVELVGGHFSGSAVNLFDLNVDKVSAGTLSTLRGGTGVSDTLELGEIFIGSGAGSVAVGRITGSNTISVTTSSNVVTIDISAGAGLGTVTEVSAGYGLLADGVTGGTITTTGELSLSGSAKSLNELASAGLVVKKSDQSISAVQVVTIGEGISVSNGDGVAGNITISSSAQSASVANTIVLRDSSGGVTAQSLTGALHVDQLVASTAIADYDLLVGSTSASEFVKTPLVLGRGLSASLGGGNLTLTNIGVVSASGDSNVLVNINATGTASVSLASTITVDIDANIVTASSLLVETSFKSNGSFATTLRSVAAGTSSVSNTDHLIIANASAGNVVLQLPTPTITMAAREYTIKREDTSEVNFVQVDAGVGNSIDGNRYYDLHGPYQSITLICDGGSKWYVI